MLVVALSLGLQQASLETPVTMLFANRGKIFAVDRRQSAYFLLSEKSYRTHPVVKHLPGKPPLVGAGPAGARGFAAISSAPNPAVYFIDDALRRVPISQPTQKALGRQNLVYRVGAEARDSLAITCGYGDSGIKVLRWTPSGFSVTADAEPTFESDRMEPFPKENPREFRYRAPSGRVYALPGQALNLKGVRWTWPCAISSTDPSIDGFLIAGSGLESRLVVLDRRGLARVFQGPPGDDPPEHWILVGRNQLVTFRRWEIEGGLRPMKMKVIATCLMKRAR